MDDVVNPNVKSALSQSPKPNVKSMSGNQHSANQSLHSKETTDCFHVIPNQPRINVRVTDEELKAFSLKAGSHVIDDQRLVQTPDAAK